MSGKKKTMGARKEENSEYQGKENNEFQKKRKEDRKNQTKEDRKKKTKKARRRVLNLDRSSFFPHFAAVPMPGKNMIGYEKKMKTRKKKTKEAKRRVLNLDRSSLFPHFAAVLSANAASASKEILKKHPFPSDPNVYN